MGSLGISPKRSETPATHQTAQPVSRFNDVSSNQVNRVEELLAKLETKSLALVPYGYWNRPRAQPKKSNTWLMAAVVGCIWLSSLALAIDYFSDKHSSEIAERAASTTPLIIPSPSDQADRKTAESVDRLTKALANSSKRINQIEAALRKSNSDLQHFQTSIDSAGAKTVKQEFQAPPVEMKNTGSPPKAGPNPPVTLVESVTLAQAPPKTPNQVLSIKPTDAAIAHKSGNGAIDYWLVARGVFKELERVQPIAVAAEGVVIHNLEDGKNYTLTRQGEWRNAEW